MSRLPPLTPDRLNPEQKRVYDNISGDVRRQKARKHPIINDDGTLIGPFNALLYAPGIGDAVQKLGAALRFESSLPGHLRELAILMVAQRWRANYEWVAHAPIAAREGLGDAVIEVVKAGRTPDAQADVLCVHRFVSELLETRRVSDETYTQTRALIGEQGLVELVSLVGYYAIISGLLNGFEVAVPEGEPLPFGA